MATSASRRLQDEVTCSICIEHFDDPRVLPCLHSFCRHCLEELAVHSEGRGKLVCPLCKAEFQVICHKIHPLGITLSVSSVSRLIRDFEPLQHHTILSLDEIKSGKLLAMSKTSYCTKHKGKKLKLFCESCKEVICRDCTVVDHKN
ncbi:predicted protein, partial [Nematostella vectensis]